MPHPIDVHPIGLLSVDGRPAPVVAGVAAVLALALVSPVPAQDSQGRVKVQMPPPAAVGVAGDAVIGVELRLTNLESGASTSVATGADGAFAFEGLEPGPYRLHVTVPGGSLDETVSIALPLAFSSGTEGRAGKPREIVVVGMREPPRAGKRIPVHTPEWTDLSDHDPGVAAGEGHGEWIELTSVSPGGDGESLLLTIPPEAWAVGKAGAYFDLYVGADRSGPEGSVLRRPPPAREGAEAGAVRGAVVFGDGIHGRRPAAAKVAPVLRAEPAEPPKRP